LDNEKAGVIAEHLESCQFCREYCENCRQYQQCIVDSASDKIPERAVLLADRLFAAASRGQIIHLSSLTTTHTSASVLLAADGERKPGSKIRNLATLYSETPEVVLRVMRDFDHGYDYVQLIADDPNLTSHVMVQIPRSDQEFITDADGKAVIDKDIEDGFETSNWQIKMPDAVFSLEPLTYDPDRVEYAKEMTLETNQHDRIEVRFEGKTEGKQISIRIIELQGQTDFDTVRVSVTQDNLSKM
ncbi:unnamed protein product, partial [marine sediment metagenome]